MVRKGILMNPFNTFRSLREALPQEQTAGAPRNKTPRPVPDVNPEYRKALEQRAKWIEESEGSKQTQQGMEASIVLAAEAWYTAKQEVDSKCGDLVGRITTYLLRFNPAKADVLRLLRDNAKEHDKHASPVTYQRGDETIVKTGRVTKDYAPMATRLYKLAAWDAGLMDPERDSADGIKRLETEGVRLNGRAFFSCTDALHAGYGINVVDAAFTAVLRPRKPIEVNQSERVFDEARKAAAGLSVVIYDPASVGKAGGRPTRRVKVLDHGAAAIAGVVIGLIEAAQHANISFTKQQVKSFTKVHDLMIDMAPADDVQLDETEDTTDETGE